MDFSWLMPIRKALVLAGALRSFAKYLLHLFARLSLIEERRESERIRNDGEQIRNLLAYIKAFDAYARSMRAHGATDADVQAAMCQLLHPRMRNYLKTTRIIRLKKPPAKTVRPKAQVQLRVSIEPDSAAPPAPSGMPPSPPVERRVMQLAPEQAPFKKRISDPER